MGKTKNRYGQITQVLVNEQYRNTRSIITVCDIRYRPLNGSPDKTILEVYFHDRFAWPIALRIMSMKAFLNKLNRGNYYQVTASLRSPLVDFVHWSRRARYQKV